MRVVIVNKFARITGGADRHCLELAALLRERDHEVVFVSTAGPGNLESEGAFVEPTVTALTRDALPLAKRAEVALNAFWNADAAAATRRLVERFRPDVVHAHKLYPQLSVAPVAVASRLGIPIVQTLHDYELVSASAVDARGGLLDHDEARATYRALNSAVFPVRRRIHVRYVQAFVTVSRLVARIYRRHGVAATVLPNFVRPPAGSPGGFDERSGIVYVGRLTREKGVLDVVELARRLPDVPVTLLGSGPLEAEIRRRSAGLANIQLAGFRQADEIERIVGAARLVVVPSRWQEPGPLVPLESMALGTPVIAFANGGLAEYVDDTGGGRVVPSDAESLARACAEVIDDRGAWEVLSRRALEGVAARHAPHAYAERLEAVYGRVAAAV